VPPTPAPSELGPVARPPRTAEFAEAVRLSERVIHHLRQQPRTGPYDIAASGMSQSGMVEALGATQSAIAKVVRRLVASGVLLETREHVQGSPTRLKVYRLTPLGEALARDMRTRRRAGTPPSRDMIATSRDPGEPVWARP